jgi:hypothetical protein
MPRYKVHVSNVYIAFRMCVKIDKFPEMQLVIKFKIASSLTHSEIEIKNMYWIKPLLSSLLPD